MKLIYDKSKIDNYQFLIYYLYYKKKPEIIEFTYNY